MTPEQDAQLNLEAGRGARAERLLADDMLQEAFTQIEDAITKAWKNAPIRDTEGQSMLLMRLKALGEVRKYIAEVAQTGRMASQELARERTLRERAANALRAVRR